MLLFGLNYLIRQTVQTLPGSAQSSFPLSWWCVVAIYKIILLNIKPWMRYFYSFAVSAWHISVLVCFNSISFSDSNLFSSEDSHEASALKYIWHNFRISRFSTSTFSEHLSWKLSSHLWRRVQTRQQPWLWNNINCNSQLFTTYYFQSSSEWSIDYWVLETLQTCWESFCFVFSQ